jgi:hypothetical protein
MNACGSATSSNVTLLPFALAYSPTSARDLVDASEKSMHARMCFAAMAESYHLSDMQGMRTASLGLALSWAVCTASITSGCTKASNAESTTAATASSEETPPRSSRPTRGEVSCHLHSCAPPMYCNRDSGLCELLPCTESRDCPYGYKCDFSRGVCQ